MWLPRLGARGIRRPLKVAEGKINSIRILQINMNHCRTAHDLLFVNALKFEVDLVVVSEPYRIPDNWYADNSGRAAIWVTGAGIDKGRSIALIKRGNEFVIIRYNEVYICSVYVSPNIDIQKFENCTSELEMSLLNLEKKKKLLVMGDFNAKSPLWGSDRWVEGGEYELCGSANLCPTIASGGNTCEKGGGSKIDILMGDKRTIQDLAETRVIDEYSASDHRYVLHVFKRKDNGAPTLDPFELNKGKLRKEDFVKTFLKKYGEKEGLEQRTKWTVL